MAMIPSWCDGRPISGAGDKHRSHFDAIPVASIALILGVDRFMSEARALTNLIGNGVATVVVAKWEGALDEARMIAHLDRETVEEADEPEKMLPAPEPMGS
jgi:aerobic C4-dicarboxylate transport protein